MEDNQLRAAGQRALLVPARGPAGLARQIRDAASRADLRLREVTPGARTVLVEADSAADLARLRALLGGLVEDPTETRRSDVVSIAVRFDGADLGWAADAAGASVGELIALVAATELTAAFCGFAPGFAYLTGLPPRLSVARLDRPRTRVPAGSFAIAGGYAAIYPNASPGGWRLLGRTDEVMFDPAREPPALVSPGTRVRVVAVS